MIGRVFSHYRIEQKLGEGGMGVVYLARDLELNRMAALKLISAEVATEEHRGRFQQEAQLASSLNHPHILAVYEAGTVEGQQYLISEFVDGVTLREWAQRNPPSLRQVLELMVGIADALAGAHQVGIVHRDVKPENILVARQGYAKLADFGLAKLVELGSDPETDTRTDLHVRTRAGVVVGTLPYMAPEQLAGKAVDPRADIFSLGVVLYELLAGQRPFGGGSAVELLQAMTRGEARPLSEVQPGLPLEVCLIVQKALETEPGERYQSMREMVLDLKRALRIKPGVPAPGAAAATAFRPRRWGWALAATLVFGGGTFAWLRSRPDSWPNPLADAQFTRLTDFEGAEREADISSDGKFVAFLSDRGGALDAWVGQIGTGEFHNLSKGQVSGEVGGEGLRNVTFSADGSQVCLWVRPSSPSGGTGIGIWAVPTMGGPVRPFLEGAAEVDWSPDGSRMVYHTTAPGDPTFVTEAGEKVGRQIYVAPTGEHCHFPTWSPDGRWIYFTRGFPPYEMDIWRIPPTGGEPERITAHRKSVSHPTFLDERTLVYVAPAEDDSGPWLFGMDLDRRIPYRMSLGVERYTSIAASSDGQRLVTTVGASKGSLWRVPITDHARPESEAVRIPVPTGHAVSPALGSGYLLYRSSRGGAHGVWKLENGNARELWSSREGPVTATPAVSPDGRLVALSVKKGERTRLYLMNADGTSARPLADSLDVRGRPAWSPDGGWIAVAADRGKGAQIFRVPVDGGPPLLTVEEYSIDPVWSPDGHVLVYAGRQVGYDFPVKAVTVAGAPRPFPELKLPRGAQVRFLPGALVLLKGGLQQGNFWLVNLQTGRERPLTAFPPGFGIGQFDVSSDGGEIVFDRLEEFSDVVLITRPRP